MGLTGAARGDDAPVILALNAGSSSVKFAVFEAAAGLSCLDRGEIDHPDEGEADGLVGTLEKQLQGRRIAAIGHRVVHGGAEFAQPVAITPAVLAALEALTPLAPLHQPLCLRPVGLIGKVRPDLPQFACFDTGFHHGLQPPVSRYALPRRYEAMGIRKYGFHGLSYAYIAHRLRELSLHLAARKTVVAHLGSGASLCAMQDGISVDTTMGFSVLDGVVMATRPGSLDPGVLLYLLGEQKMTADELEALLYHQSGLLGVSGISGDVRTLLASSDDRAREALELFAFSVSRQVAALANSLDGLEALVFTGGVGEHAAAVREMVCSRLRWLGLQIDVDANARHAERIDTPQSAIEVRIMPTNEELTIARQVAPLIGIAAEGEAAAQRE